MFSASLAIVNYALIDDRWQLLTVLAEFDGQWESREAFISHFTVCYGAAGDERFKYHLVEKIGSRTVRDYYTKRTLEAG